MKSEFIVVMRNSKASHLRKWIALERTYSTYEEAQANADKNQAEDGRAWEFRVAEIQLPDFNG